MLPISSFPSWLGTLLGQSESETKRLLSDESALHFLIAWSLFESKCFGGFVKAKDIGDFAKRACCSIDWQVLRASAEHFHTRYQRSTLFKNLMHGQTENRLSTVLQSPFNEVCDEDRLYFLVFVTYRYRNNIFHGNKGIQSWLQYREQIKHCTRAMQVMVSHSEASAPTMSTAAS